MAQIEQVLEFEKVKAMVAAHLRSAYGQDQLAALTPQEDRALVSRWLDEGDEAERFLTREGGFLLPPCPDVRQCVTRAEKDGVLEGSELNGVRFCIQGFREARTILARDEELPLLGSLAAALLELDSVERGIEYALSPDGSVLDQASPELRRIRHERRQLRERIRAKMDGLIRATELQKYLQDAIITVRNDRYVVPVKSEFRGRLPGIIHDQSASGHTIFVEPMALVDMNNDLTRLEMEEREEVQRILQQLSESVGRCADAIRSNCELYGRLDVIFAKSRFARQYHCIRPIIDEAAIRLLEARHPLIPVAEVVPVTVTIEADKSLLVVSGPNTGGKTVVLKTIGLFVLMAKCGLFIPAAKGSGIPLFRHIFVNIGDEQSIEQNLSTFSSHMRQLISMLADVGSQDLVLIDEIGTGTDPEEGAAIAAAILDELVRRSCKAVVTTHYQAIKVYASTNPKAINGRMDFDSQNFRPTYRLTVGLPGGSYALRISERLGLPYTVLERARTYLNPEYLHFEQVLTSLEEEQRRAEEIRLTLSGKQEALNLALAEVRQQQLELDRNREKQLAKAKRDAQLILHRVRQETEALRARLQELEKETDREKRRKQLRGIQSVTGELMSTLGGTEREQPDTQPLPEQELTPGRSVYLRSLEQAGVIQSVSGNTVTVQVGSLRMNVKRSECHRLPAGKTAVQVPDGEPVRRRAVRVAEATAAAAVPLEIDVRGQTADEAITVVDRQIDQAALHGILSFTIIHGKGTGALRKQIRQYLNRHPQVADCEIGAWNQGGDGVTVVKLK